jgi:Post-segregation antitoxin CcdA
MKKKPKPRGGKREGAGRKPQGKVRINVTLTEVNVAKARERTSNFSGLLDKVLSEWLEKH